METSTLRTRKMLDYLTETQLRLSSMHSTTVREMRKLDRLLVGTGRQGRELSPSSSHPILNLQLQLRKLNEQVREVTSSAWMAEEFTLEEIQLMGQSKHTKLLTLGSNVQEP